MTWIGLQCKGHQILRSTQDYDIIMYKHACYGKDYSSEAEYVYSYHKPIAILCTYIRTYDYNKSNMGSKGQDFDIGHIYNQ